MSKSKILFYLGSIIIFFVIFSDNSFATNIRGQIIGRYNATGYQMPLYGARVDLYIWNGAQWIMVFTWITGEDGMYYMNNIQPGNYVLQVNRQMNYNIIVYPQLYQDINPIIVFL